MSFVSTDDHFYGSVPLLRHQIIESLTASHPEKAADTAIVLWGLLATQIVAIIGVGGFNSLYARSLFLTQSSFPWLTGCELPCPAEQRFAALKNCLRAQASGDAIQANNHLLRTFTDILADLIGEEPRLVFYVRPGAITRPHKISKRFKHD